MREHRPLIHRLCRCFQIHSTGFWCYYYDERAARIIAGFDYAAWITHVRRPRIEITMRKLIILIAAAVALLFMPAAASASTTYTKPSMHTICEDNYGTHAWGLGYQGLPATNATLLKTCLTVGMPNLGWTAHHSTGGYCLTNVHGQLGPGYRATMYTWICRDPHRKVWTKTVVTKI